MTPSRLLLSAAALALAVQPLPAIAAQDRFPPPPPAGNLIPVSTFTLPNGLKVVMHVDRSDPVVAVSLNARVGSSSEEPGRTGFAHMFEHLFFLDSENVGKGGLDKLSARIGGSGANGSTNRDMTDYLQTVPRDALEKMIWAEADKIGFFINTVTPAVLAKEKQVVKNEKRQSYDNQPYGHTETVITENLYPKDHPYSWTVIGSLADLDAAQLDDVRNFYRRWYVPNNVTLVIAGDFEPAQARAWVERYFGEFKAGPKVTLPAVRPAGLTASRSFYHEDNFAELPELTIAWPTVPAYHPDMAALLIADELLTNGKEAPLHAVLVDEKKLTSEVTMFANNGRVAGESYLVVRGFDGADLDTVKAALDDGFARFERTGVDPAALERAKTRLEVDLYNDIGSVLGKVRRLAEYDLYVGDPNYADRYVASVRAVTAADVMRVYNRYLKGRPHVATSFVPKGKVDLALNGASKATVVEEPIVQGAEAPVDASAAASYARTPSSFDRTVEPAYGPTPSVKLPAVWQGQQANGLRILGIEDNELPVVRFELAIKGGRLQDDPAKPGASNLVARMFTRGTARRTPAELENALKTLGAEVRVDVRNEHFVVTGSTLARNFEKTVDLVEEMLLEPRWDAGELVNQKAATVSDIQSARVSANAIAQRAFELATFGEGHIYSRNPLGTEKSVAALTMDDLKAYQARHLAPNLANFRVVGAVPQARVATALSDLGTRWQRQSATVPEFGMPAPPAKATVLFYDLPDAKQSVFAFGYLGPKRADPAFYPAVMSNYILGGGGFASRLTQQLREGKGYTYNVRSQFTGAETYGTFQIGSGVRANVTLEAAELTKDILTAYPTTFTPADLDVTKAFLTKSRARSFETSAAKLGYLGAVADYGLTLNYPEQEQAMVDALTVDQVKATAAAQIRPGAMTYVIVGDGTTQAARLDKLGFGPVQRINERLKRVEE